MLTIIGKPPASGDAVDLLLECHDRIRSFLALARRLGGAASAERGEVADAAARVSRYFTQALPLHARDEEDSILPRLHGRDPDVDLELETMVREHAEHEQPLGALVKACDVLAREPERHGELAREIARAADALERHFALHLRREEEVVFPAVRRLLHPTAISEVVREIRARRGVVEPPPEPGPIVQALEADHVLLDALLSGAVVGPAEIDRRAFDDFREGLLRHIAIEEKILLPAAREARGGKPIPEARQLRVEHGALAALLVPAPTPEIVGEIRKILGPHNTLEEDGEVYDTCESLLADRTEEIVRRIRAYPTVRVAPYNDGPRVCRTAEEALRISAMQSAPRT